MEDKKTSVLALLRILEEHTDDEHILSQPDLLNLLDTIYDVKLERRTLYKNIEMLQDFGFDISTFSENGKGYYLRDRQFEKSQIYLLCNAIHASNFIPASSSKELINKLLSTQSKYIKNEFKSTVYIENSKKKDNKEFFLNLEIIAEAIKNKQVISFNYTKYNFDKKLENRRPEPYYVSPYYLVYDEDKTYLVSRSPNHNDLTHFRLDRMKNVKITDDKYIKLEKNQDPYEYAASKIFMYNGDDIKVKLKCINGLLDNILDIFGTGIRIEKCDDEHFIVNIKSTLRGMYVLALHYLDAIEVLEPKELRDKLKNAVKEANKKYK